MKVTFNIWDITKSILAVIIVFSIIFNFNGFLDRFSRKDIDEAVITRISENVVKAQISENKKEFKELLDVFKKSNSEALRYAEKNSERIDELGKVTTELKQTRTLGTESQHTYLKGKEQDHYFTKIYGKDADGKVFPIAWAMFHPNKPDDKKWKTGSYPLEFYTNIVETELDNGKFGRYAEVNFTGPGNKESRGVIYKADVKELTWAKNPKSGKNFDFNPRFGLGGFFGSDDIYPGLDLSLFSYGRTHRDMEFRFITLGLGYNDNIFYGNFRPFEYNIGNFVPLVENVFLGPSATFSSDLDSPVFGISASVPF